MAISITPRLARRAATGIIVATLSMTAAPAFADIYVYWSVFGTTIQLGRVPTVSGFAESADGTEHHTDQSSYGESHMAIVCERGNCGIVGDCKACHVTPKRASTFNGRVADRHRRNYFPRATMAVGATPVAFDGGFVQMEAGRMVLRGRDRTPTYRLPHGARLLRDTRTGQPLFIVYDGRSAPEPVRR